MEERKGEERREWEREEMAGSREDLRKSRRGKEKEKKKRGGNE